MGIFHIGGRIDRRGHFLLFSHGHTHSLSAIVPTDNFLTSTMSDLMASPCSVIEELMSSVALHVSDMDDEDQPFGASISSSDSDDDDLRHSSFQNSEDEILRQQPRRRSVSFDKVQVRHYKNVIGDHPFCTEGLPLSLGWDYTAQADIALDEYEAQRLPVRKSHRRLLKTTSEERNEILLSCGEDDDQGTSSCYSTMELRQTRRKLHRVRSTQRNLNLAFFTQ